MCMQQNSRKIGEPKTDKVIKRNKPPIIVADFNTLLSIIDKTSRQNISRHPKDILYTYKFGNSDKMDQPLRKHKLSQLTQYETEYYLQMT